VSKDKKKSNKKQSDQKNQLRAEPWISMRSGLIIIAITSLGMTVLTAIQAVPALGWVEGLFWSVLFGVLIWVIFFGMNLINRFLRR
jgi:uncharacterized membrane protein